MAEEDAENTSRTTIPERAVHSPTEGTGRHQYSFRCKDQQAPQVLGSQYAINEVVLVFWCQGLYPAKVLKIHNYRNQWWRYYITYMQMDPIVERQDPEKMKKQIREKLKKQNKEDYKPSSWRPKEKVEKATKEVEDIWENYIELDHWREWIGTKRLMKVSPENIRKMKSLAAKRVRDPRRTWHEEFERPSENENEDSLLAKKRNLEERLSVKVSPSFFMTYIEDRETSLHLGKIVEYPDDDMSAKKILTDFCYHLEDSYPDEVESVGKVEGLISFFEKQFDRETDNRNRTKKFKSILLYPTEGYEPKPDTSPSEMFGGVHIVRMIVNSHKLRDSAELQDNMIRRLLSYMGNDEEEHDLEEDELDELAAILVSLRFSDVN